MGSARTSNRDEPGGRVNESQLQAADYIVLVGYFALMLAIGLYFRRFMHQARDYFTGDNQVPWWLAGASYYMTTFSAFAFIAYGEVAYLYGWVAVTLGWVAVPACLVAAWWIAQRWRRARVSTPVEFLEERYSPLFRQLFAWTGFPLRLVDNGLKLYALGVFVSAAVGMDIIWSIVISAVVLLAYTFFGGIWAVTVTDFVQGIVLYLALLIILPLAVYRNGGLGLGEALPDGEYLRLFNPPYTGAYVAGVLVLIVLNYNAGWALVQRFYSVRDEREARKVGLVAAGLHLVGPPLFYLPVILSRDLLTGLENTRYAYASMALTLLPVGMMGIIITAMFSATMSSLSSEYNVMASVATRDIYARLFKRNASEEHLLNAGKVFTGLIGLVTLVVGIIVAMNPDTPLFSLMVTVFGVAVAPMMLPLLGGLLFPGLGRRGAMVGFLVGLAVGFTTLGIQRYYLPGVPGLHPEWISFQFGAYAIFINVGVTLLAMMLWSVLERKDAAERQRIHAFFARMDAPVEAPPPPPPGGRSPSPYFITGAAVLGIGAMLLVVSFFTRTELGRWIDLGAGVALMAIGALLYRTRPHPGTAAPSPPVHPAPLPEPTPRP
jgi:SSS family solute:Na+ symporter